MEKMKRKFSEVQLTSIIKYQCLAESTVNYKIKLYELLYQSIAVFKKSLEDDIDKKILAKEYETIFHILFIVGTLDIYHSWEKGMTQFLKQEIGPVFKSKHKGISFDNHVRNYCEKEMNIIIADKVWNKIKELREVVNAYKHGTKEKFQSLREKYPEYFKLPKKYLMDNGTDYSLLFRITKTQFIGLSKNIIHFWRLINKAKL